MPPVIEQVIRNKNIRLTPPCDRNRLKDILDRMEETGARISDLSDEDQRVLQSCAEQYLSYLRGLRTSRLN